MAQTQNIGLEEILGTDRTGDVTKFNSNYNKIDNSIGILSDTKLTKPTGATDQFLNGIGVPTHASSVPLVGSGNPFSADGAARELAKKTNINTTTSPDPNMPIGSYIYARIYVLTAFIGGIMNVYFADNYSYTTAVTGSPVTGTWRLRGAVDAYNQVWNYTGLFERVA